MGKKKKKITGKTRNKADSQVLSFAESIWWQFMKTAESEVKLRVSCKCQSHTYLGKKEVQYLNNMIINKVRNKTSLFSIFMLKDLKNFFLVFPNTHEEASFANGGNNNVASSRIFKAQGKLKSVCLAQPENHSHNKKKINASLPLATTCSAHMCSLKI